MLDAADVVVGWGVEVCLEAVSEGEFVVDLIFEKEHFLYEDRLVIVGCNADPPIYIVHI